MVHLHFGTKIPPSAIFCHLGRLTRMLASRTGRRKTRRRSRCSWECCLSRLLNENGLQTAMYLGRCYFVLLWENMTFGQIGDILRGGGGREDWEGEVKGLFLVPMWENVNNNVTELAGGMLTIQRLVTTDRKNNKIKSLIYVIQFSQICLSPGYISPNSWGTY